MVQRRRLIGGANDAVVVVEVGAKPDAVIVIVPDDGAISLGVFGGGEGVRRVNPEERSGIAHAHALQRPLTSASF